MANFWAHLPEPFFVLAPMENVTDLVFRDIIAELSPPDVLFTEFTAVDGLFSKGREETLEKLRFSAKQRPIVAQIWGVDPELFYKTTLLVTELGFDGIDINMGCPDRAVCKRGAGAASIKNPDLAKELIAAVKRGAGEKIAVSVKTRLGFNEIKTLDWIPFLLEQKIDALTVHGRIATQMSKGAAHWDEIGKAVKLRDQIAPQTVLIGNGDVKDYAHGVELHKKYHVDGLMIGRGIFVNPWVFDKSDSPAKHDKQEYLDLLVKHMDLYVDTWGETHHFDILKKFFKMYVREFDGANELRIKLMECKNRDQVKEVLLQDKSLK